MHDHHAGQTHVLMTTDDLALLEHRLGRRHAICERLRDALADCTAPRLQDYRAAALRHHRDGELEIDPGAVVSKGGDPGAYVMAWLWIDDSELTQPRALMRTRPPRPLRACKSQTSC